MNIKTKIVVAIAFVVAALYTFEVTLTLINQGLVGPAFIKAGIVVACFYYAITRLARSKATNEERP
ncbi:MAG: hypothetical protein ACM34I_07670 [bacterium]